MKKKPVRLMTHLVAGYPSFEDNLKLLTLMEESGVAMVEIQIPFSDPIADGSTITGANFKSLAKGTTLSQVWDFIERARRAVKIPLLIMTYYNIPYQLGFSKFFKLSEKAGIDYVIIPDLPFDEAREDYFMIMADFKIKPVIVVSPTTQKKRLLKIKSFLKKSRGMLYTTLKVGTTGAKQKLNQEGVSYLKGLREELTEVGKSSASTTTPNIPLAAGFGISTPEQALSIGRHTDFVVIGSHIIELFDREGLGGVREFLLKISLKTAL